MAYPRILDRQATLMTGLITRIKHRIMAFLFMGRYRFTQRFCAWEHIVVRAPEEKMSELCMQWAFVHKIEGDYLEFGVFWGRSFIRAYHLAQLYRLPHMRFYAFDSFRGLPPIAPGSIDDTPLNTFFAGQFTCTRENFRTNLIRHGIDTNKIDIIPGWYKDMLTPTLRRQLPTRKAAIVWIDCDLYESTVPVLDFVTPYVQDGTIFMFDDWFAFRGRPDLGQPRAFAEWLSRNPHIRATEYHRSEWAAMAFILHVYPDAGAALRASAPTGILR